MSSTTTAVLTARRSGAVAPAGGAGASAGKKPSATPTPFGVSRVPTERPPFTVGDIRRAIPAHCFSRPLYKSFGYLFWDLAIVYALYCASGYISLLSDELLGATYGPVARHALWLCYWIAQGCVMTGLWVIGHECGHRGFADSELINDVVGLVVHSAVLVPYFAWQISHRRHHSNTGSVEHDEVFVPALATPAEIEAHRKKLAGQHEHDEDGALTQLYNVAYRLFFMGVMFTVGWPGYLLSNISGNRSYDPKAWVNHFFPESPIFTSGSEADAHNQKLILISDLALLAMFGVLYKWVSLTSLSHVVYVYFIPYLIVNFWLVLITYLQHTDLQLPHYTHGEWDWLRGALATVDRDYGILNRVFHHITDTHVVHHLFSFMPHYHAQEATEAVKPLLGDYYLMDRTPVFTALWNAYRDCNVLYPDEKNKGVHWFEPEVTLKKQ